MPDKIYISGDAIIVEDNATGDNVRDAIKGLIYYTPSKLQVDSIVELVIYDRISEKYPSWYTTDLSNVLILIDGTFQTPTKIQFREFCNLNLGKLNASPESSDFGFDASLGLISDVETVNKFGEAIDCDSGAPTDLWDGANASGGSAIGTKIWIPPTQARVHQFTSSNGSDSSAGIGVRTVEIFYLPDWDTSEASIIINTNGLTNVALPSLVIINRMEALTWGAAGVSIGDLKATADVDGTVTSAIISGSNQTQQCIYGIPSIKKLRVKEFFSSIVKGTGATQRADGEVLFMRDPAVNAVNNTAWTNKENFLLVEGNNPWTHKYEDVPKKFDGPCIVKIQVVVNSNNVKCIGGFDALLKTV